MKKTTLNITKKTFLKGEIFMMKKMIITIMTLLLFVIAAPATTKAAVSNGIVYDGEGSTSKQLTTGQNLTGTLADCKLKLDLAGKDLEYPYGKSRCVGTFVIADDDLVHTFWLTGEYIVVDGRNGATLIAGQTGYDVANMKVSYIKVSSTKDERRVLALTGLSIHTCIISNQFFYNENRQMMHLMTRAEFEALISGQTPAPSTAPATAAPTAIPAPSAAPATEKPAFRTEAPMPTLTPSTMAPLPTFAPLPTPVVNPSEADTNISVDIWWERYRRGEITWEQYWQVTFGMNIDTKEHTESTTETTAEFWWKKYENKEITWDQLTQIIWGTQWHVEEVEDEDSITYYFYNDDKTIDHTRTVSKKTKQTSGEGQGSAQAQNDGTATVKSDESGNGGVTAESKTVSDTTSQTSVTGNLQAANQGKAQWQEEEKGHAVANASIKSNKASKNTGKTTKAKKGKTKYYTIYPEGQKGAVNLTISKNGKDSSVAGIRVDYTSKTLSKRYAYWDKEHYYGLVYAGFNNKGSVVIMVKQNGKYITYVLKRGKNNKAGKKYKPRTFKGYDKVIKEKVRGNAIRLKNSKTKKYVDIANLVPKKLKKAKAKAKANK